MRIGLDFDGVIADSSGLKTCLAKKLFGITLPEFCFKKKLILELQMLSQEQHQQLEQAIYGSFKNSRHLLQVDNCFYYLLEFARRHEPLRVITSRSDDELAVAKDWLQRRGQYLSMISTHGTTKLEAARGLDVFVDDDLDKLRPLVGVVEHLFLFSWKYNLGDREAGIATRVYSWDDLAAKLNKL